ncbi:ExbD/TolR family protein [Turicimonas muris]|uniref:Biopolymer transporter ExbD n=1 Tax=Turicimonas muris TaxID=1796652 RepID=A0A227KJY6_9BURK|nr:biopolymer transporter ExbD [Turicimonas muris]ANU67032.1 biopolymer transporter ExbD [Burkholderiales bacterium YL45]MBS4767411.1 biopolymer transporter ExbD [Burkholderiales bacterium]OXE47660.1 biopolymer transporter ExbD [Turicimonas muris]QQQ95886.1 biopolymer transporter ExbD [Turicimonas muris]
MFDDLDEEPKVDLTPLIDVIFMLVIFFVMTMTFSKPVIDLTLPAAENSLAQKNNQELILQVNEAGTILWNDKALSKEELPVFLDEHPEGLLTLMIDEKAPFQSFVWIVDVAKVKREGRFVIGTRKNNSG